jgi:hypothetical protein
MSTFTNKLLGLDVTTGSPLTVTTGDTVSTGGNWTFTENVVISQDLTVNGTTTTINTQDVLIADRFVVQSYNYQSPAATPQTAGNVYVVEADPDSLGTFTIDNTKNASLVTAGSVTAGDSGFTTTADPTALVAGDIISVTGLTVDPENNGLYEVKGTSTAPNQIAIKTVPESSVDGIVNNAIAGAATQADSGTTVQTHIMVIRANTDGTTMSIGYGQQTALTFATIGVAGSATLGV